MKANQNGLKKYQPALTNCSHCNVLLRPEQVAKHIRKKHQGNTNLPASAANVRPLVKRKKPGRKFANYNLVATCPECGRVMQGRLLQGHLKLHEQIKNNPVPVRPVPSPQQRVAADTYSEKPNHTERPLRPPKSAQQTSAGKQNIKQKRRRSTSLQNDWYRDGAGDLWFGEQERRQLHIVDTGPVFRIKAKRQDNVMVEEKSRQENDPQQYNSVQCPYCQIFLPETHVMKHMQIRHPELVTGDTQLEFPRTLNSTSEKSVTIPSDVPTSSYHTSVTIDTQLIPPSESEEVWYRDSDGDLCFGIPPAVLARRNERNKPAQDRPQAGQTGAVQTREIPIDTAVKPREVVVCPICQNQVRRAIFLEHIQKHPNAVKCPVCHRYCRKSVFALHMRQHPDWCPVCQQTVERLGFHLLESHRLRAAVAWITFFAPGWKDQPRFTCAVCGAKLSVNEFPSHQCRHRKGLKKSKKADRNEKAICPICQNEFVKFYMQFHIDYEHPACPHCSTRMARQDLARHIDMAHPDQGQKNKQDT